MNSQGREQEQNHEHISISKEYGVQIDYMLKIFLMNEWN